MNNTLEVTTGEWAPESFFVQIVQKVTQNL